MMMIFRSYSNKNRFARDRGNGRRSVVFGILAVIALIALLHFFLPGRPFAFFGKLAIPFWKGAEVAREGVDMITISKRELLRQNAELREEVETLRFRTLRYEIALQENEELKEALGRDSDVQLVLAAILAKPPISPYDSFIVDIGKDRDIEAGDHVYAFGGVAVGEIFDVGKTLSKVRLFSSPGNAIDVFIGEDHIPAKAIGKGGGNFEVRLPRGMEMETGEIAVIPSLHPIVLGEVEHIARPENDSFQTLFIKSPVNLWHLRFVEVGLGTAQVMSELHSDEYLLLEWADIDSAQDGVEEALEEEVSEDVDHNETADEL